MDNLSGCGYNDHVQGILEDIQNLENNSYQDRRPSIQESMENLQQQMQENGLDDVPWFLVYFSSRKVVKYKTWNQLDN